MSFFFLNSTATTEIYTLSLHDALPISLKDPIVSGHAELGSLVIDGHDLGSLVANLSSDAMETRVTEGRLKKGWQLTRDRKSTRLNSSHSSISYAVFCLKKKKKKTQILK